MGESGDRRVIAAEQLALLVEALRAEGRRVVAPVVRDGVLVLDDVTDLEQVARRVTDDQAPGSSRLVPDDSGRWFGWTTTSQPWKRVVFPPTDVVVSARRTDDGFVVLPDPLRAPSPLVLFGVRPCDLRALEVLDRVLLGGPSPDLRYARRRSENVLVVINCTRAAATCFCVSMGAGPRATSGFDLALTELDPGGSDHRFVVEVGSPRGAALLAMVPTTVADDQDLSTAAEAVQEATGAQRRSIDPSALAVALEEGAITDEAWQRFGDRCLGCGNCTAVCPTCFCTSIEDQTSLDGLDATRVQRWESCFAEAHSFVHGGPVRRTRTARYHQWFTHKLSTWVDQFGELGCVGCGRCITWCPAAIDLTESAAELVADGGRR
jgi:ferredoxin